MKVCNRISFSELKVLLSFLIITLYMFSTQSGDAYSRVTLYLTTIFHLVLGYGIRLAWKPIVRRLGKNSRKAAMILDADEKHAPEILERLSSTDDVKYVGIILSNRDGTGEEIQGVPVVASLETAADYICREWVDEVFVYPERLADIEAHYSEFHKSFEGFIEDLYSDHRRKDYSRNNHAGGSVAATVVEEQVATEEREKATVSALIEACRQMAIPVHIRLSLSSVGGKSFIEKVGGYTVLTTAVNYASPLQLAIKRALDIAGGLVGSLIALVVIAVAAPQIKRESPGPILFKQTRIGLNGKCFQIFKIRTMYLDAEERKAELMKDNRVSDGMMFKLDFDPRIIGNKI